MSIAFDDNIPRRGPAIWIKRMKAGEKKQFTFWGTKIRGMWVHYNSATNKSEPHYEEGCTCETRPIPKRWKGFLHGYCHEDKQEVFLELTPTAAQSLLEQLAEPDKLRGLYCHVRRTSAANGRLQVQVLGYVNDQVVLPKEKDPRRSICQLWGVSEALLQQLFGPKDAGEEVVAAE